jgi:hypothetical protein
MSIYHFVLRSPTGQVEELGFLPLADDTEAVSFGKTVIREIVQENPALYAGVVMKVTEGDRGVGPALAVVATNSTRRHF